MSGTPSGNQDDLLNSLLGDFLDESDQLLAQLNANLLQLDEWVRSLDDQQQRCDEDLLNDMFRAAHSLKGLSAMLGLGDINNLTHKIENVFDAARKDELTVGAEVVDLMFLGLDQLTALVDLLKEPGGEPVDCDPVLDQIRQVLQSAGAERKPSSQADAERALDADDAEAAAPAPAEPEPPADAAPPPPPLPDPLAGLEDEADVPDKYLAIFIDEAELSLDALTGTLLALEDGPDDDAPRRLMATAHKIKGSAASIGLNRAAKLAHLMEDLLQSVGETRSPLTPEMTDVLLKCADGLRFYVTDLKLGNRGSDSFGALAAELLAAGSAVGVGPEPPAEEPTGPADAAVAAPQDGADSPPNADPPQTADTPQTAEADEPATCRERPAGGPATYAGHVRFQPGLPVAALKAQLICEKLGKLGELVHCDPPVEKLDELDELESLRFRVTSEHPAETLREHLRVAGVQSMTVEPAQEPSPDETAEETPAAAPANAPADGRPPGATKAGPSGDARGGEAETAPSGAAAPAAPSPERPEAETPSRPAAPRTAEGVTRPNETVRVDIERLDHLMDLAGQLVISRAQFTQIGESLKSLLDCKHSVQTINKVFTDLDKIGNQCELRPDGQHPQAGLPQLRSHLRRIRNDLEPVGRDVQTLAEARDCVRNLFEAIHQLGRVSDGIQQSVMDTRMVPIGPLFARFNRVIRDVTRANGKSIRLAISGEKTELDKRMIDELGDPLVHMVRNSADHGVEPPEEREAAGKPRQGTVTLNAFHRGNSIVIQVSDDGKGLDTNRIIQKCVERGVLTLEDAEKMSPHQIHQMIWEPGLSTAREVTDISGRGMGMDIVRSKIEDLNGTVDVDSAKGQGTTVTIRLPLTLAILPSLMVEIAGDVFAMPMEAVVEIVRVGGDDLSTVHGRPMALVRGRVVSLAVLDEILRFHRAARDGEAARTQDATLVIVGEPGREIGLPVDRVLGEEDVVIKSMAENYKNVPGIAGASVLGDGRVSLILDVAALVDMASHGTPATAAC